MANTTAAPREVRPFGWYDKLGYAAGDMANDFTFIMVSTFFMIYATNVAGIDPMHLGFVLLLARLADAFYDLLVGRLVDILPAGPAGRFRPWIPRLAPIVAITCSLCFAPFITGWDYQARLIWVSVTYFVFGLAFSTISIPYGSMVTVISPKPAHRSQLSVFRSMGALIAVLSVLVIPPLFIYDRNAAGHSFIVPERLFGVSVVGGILALGLYAVCFAGVRERIVTHKPAEGRASFARTLASVLGNRALAALIIGALAQGLGVGMSQALIPYVCLDYFRMPQLQSLAGLLIVAPTVLLAPVATRLGLRYGKKEIVATGATISAAAGFVLAALQTHNPVVYLVGLSFAGLGQGLFALLIWAFIGDVVDDHEVQTGERDDGVIFASYSWSRKVGQAVSSGLSSWILGWLGYQASEGQGVAQSEATTTGLYTFSTAATGVLFLVLAIVLAFWFPLNRRKVAENAAILDARRHAEA